MELQLSENTFFLPGTGEIPGAFAVSQGEGFLKMACSALPDNAGNFYIFIRDLIRDELQNILRNGTCTLPAPEEREKLRNASPPVPCGGGLTDELISGIYYSLHQCLPGEKEQLREYIVSLVPEWKDIGKITFHLADNKKDTDGRHPFVFLATYPDKANAPGEVRHIPLASALKLYASEPGLPASMLKPLQDAAKENKFIGGMMENKSVFKPCLWSASEAFLFVRAIGTCRKAGIPVRLNKGSAHPKRLQLNVTVEAPPRRKGIPLSETLLRFSAAAAAGDRVLTKEELAEIMSTGGGLIRIKGEWIEADTAQVAALLHQWEQAEALAGMADVPFFRGLRMLAGIQQKVLPGEAGFTPPEDPENLCVYQPGKELTELLQGKLQTELPPFPPEIPLRPYQKQGTEWMYRMGETGLGGCLADDMGLGKTIQVLAYLEMLRREKRLSPCALVIAPASLLGNWKSEAEKFVPQMKVRILHPSECSMEEFRNHPEAVLQTCDLAVTSYGMVNRLLETLSGFRFPVILLDEAQNIKNAACQQSGAVRKLKALRKFALTGTPVENSPADLWSIFDFLTPGLLGNFTAFRESLKAMEHGKDGKCDYSPLRKLIRPCILRRLKTDRKIIQDLPDKSEIRTWCFLSDVQLKIYQRAVQQLRTELEAAEDDRRNGVILSFLMQFKQICNHPTQFTGLGEYSIERSGKFRRLAELAEEFAKRGDKVLVFTQFKEIIPPLHELLKNVYHRNGLILHGGTPVAERARAVKEFQSPGGPPFFVLSLRAAGTGLNLTAANHVVHFDRWWNPAVENQATDRAYRIGQKRNVLVHKFVCKGTLEERIDSLIYSKNRLAGDLLADGPEKLLTQMSNEELLNFIRCV